MNCLKILWKFDCSFSKGYFDTNLMPKEVSFRVVGQAKEKYFLIKEDKSFSSVFNSVIRVKALLKNDPFFGDSISKSKIPKVHIRDGITSLYRVALSNYWRLLYTIISNEEKTVVLVLNIVSHKEYNKLFGYK